MKIKEFIKNNKREILIVGGSTVILGAGVYCLLKAQQFDLHPEKCKILLNTKGVIFDALQDKEITNAFVTVEYIDGEIGIIEDVKAVAKALKK